MIEIIKENVWEVLKKKEVSLAMIYDISGNILWHKGRNITGRNIAEGAGFSKTYIQKAFSQGSLCKNQRLMVPLGGKKMSESVLLLFIKSLIISRIDHDIFLYVDSGSKESFVKEDCEIFTVMGKILGEVLKIIKNSEEKKGGLAGTSPVVEKIREKILKYSIVEEPIFLTGETGTGKSHIAELIHKYSGRKGKFKTIDTPGIPDTLFENEMFGHAKGAFTDAKTDKKGLVDEAACGTLFIDEITEISMAAQAKLLRFIDTGKFSRLGESQEREVDVRIVAATNRDLKEAINNKEFREDLYYRLNVFHISLPPLRERKQDINSLVNEKLDYLKGKKMGEGFWEVLLQYDWPGNIRELISVLKRAGFHHSNTITGEALKQIIYGECDRQQYFSDGYPDEIELVWKEIKNGVSFWDAVKKPYLSRDLKRREVKGIINKGLELTNGRYKELIGIFNLKDTDYHRLMRFLHEQNLLPKKESQ